MHVINPYTMAFNGPPMDLVRICGGYYECRKDAKGKRLGKLVAYTASYDKEHRYVGDTYVNFAKVETHTPTMHYLAGKLLVKIHEHPDQTAYLLKHSTGFCGAPEGGKAFAQMLSSLCGKRYIYPEKVVTVARTARSREESVLLFDRHEPEVGELWWIVEDVSNNFSTTGKLVAAIEQQGAKVAGILCFLNRSPEVDGVYEARKGLSLPVIPIVREAMKEYQQDDEAVRGDIAAGNIEWNPKANWMALAHSTV